MIERSRYEYSRVRRCLLLAVAALLLTGCAQPKPLVSVVDGPRAKLTLRKHDAQSELRVHLFSPDSACKFDYQGLIHIDGLQRVHSIYMTPGRKYFRVSVEHGRFIGLDGGDGDVSFVLKEGEEYLIEYKSLGTEFVGTGTNLEYEINYLHGPLSNLKHVETDYFSVCERENSR